jgi:dTDP-4-dehydrorhamnose 3,5-epimerase
MKVTPTALPEVLVVEPQVFSDDRGFFFESFNRHDFASATGVDAEFVQDNHSYSGKGVLRGLHYQIRQPQGKLMHVIQGSIFDVAVDIRPSSPTFKRWVGIELTSRDHKQLWTPPGFAHGFVVLSEAAEVFYKVTDYYAPEHERGIRWDDPDLAIEWPAMPTVVLSKRDQDAPFLSSCELPS